jgi:aromatic amino acid aminotransferase I / 2-aminoadipate transaminase
MFYEKFVTYTDSATQHPHALGQIFIAEMLGKNGWQIDGFCRWTKSLCEDYQRRRDLFLDVFRREVGSTGYATVSKPQAGMFVWIEIHLDRHPRHRSIDSAKTATIASSSRTNIPALMEELFGLLIKADVVLMPASMFAIKEDLESLDMSDYVPIGDVCSPHLPSPVADTLISDLISSEPRLVAQKK